MTIELTASWLSLAAIEKARGEWNSLTAQLEQLLEVGILTEEKPDVYTWTDGSRSLRLSVHRDGLPLRVFNRLMGHHPLPDYRTNLHEYRKTGPILADSNDDPSGSTKPEPRDEQPY